MTMREELKVECKKLEDLLEEMFKADAEIIAKYPPEYFDKLQAQSKPRFTKEEFDALILELEPYYL